MADDKGGKPPQTLMGATAIRPPERKGAEKYTYILYDPKNGTILTRTPKSWALIIIFYCIYYSCLAGFWAACMTIFLKIQINEQTPTWMMGDSIIGTNPGIGVRPAQITEKVDSGIFALDPGFEWNNPNKDVSEYIKEVVEDITKSQGLKEEEIRAEIGKIEGNHGYAFRMFEFFKAYGHATDGGMTCTDSDLDDKKYRKEKNKFCMFDQTTLGNCAKFPYGYGSNQGTPIAPCVFLKLNRIMGLKPTPIDETNVGEQTLDPNDDSSNTFLNQLKDKRYAPGGEKSIYIKCEGEYPADKEALHGKMKMHPAVDGIDNTAKIPLKYFPYDKKREYNENPLVAIEFPGLFDKKSQEKAASHGRLVHIICKGYYDKVVHSKKDKAGLVKFELYLDNKKTEN